MAGHLLQPLLHSRLAGLPGGVAEAVELNLAVFSAVAREHLEVLHRHEELVAAVIINAQAIVCRLTNFEGLQPFVLSNAVVDVDHVIAFG